MIGVVLMAGVCLCGEAPERANDFFWENDRVGFRAYGPGDVHKWSGIDVFNKCVSTNVVVHWLRHKSSKNFHKNFGQGMDDYAVGPGRGVGGVALRKDGRWLADYGDWTAYRVVTNGDARCAFELDYKLPIGGTMTLAIELERGKSLFREAVSFSPDTPLAGVEVGVGLDLNASRQHGGDVWVDDRRGIVSLFEDPHVDKEGRPVPREEGMRMSALVARQGFHALADEPQGAKMLMTKPLASADANGRAVIVVDAGADWTEAGRYRTAAEWHAYVKDCGNRYLDAMETAVSAYTPERIADFIASVERRGVYEHGFARLAANIGQLLAKGRVPEKRDLFVRLMDLCAREMPVAIRRGNRGAGNDFAVKEVVCALCELGATGTFPKERMDAWRSAFAAMVAEDIYTCQPKVGAKGAHNWAVFGAASEQARLMAGLGGSREYVEKYVSDQLRFFDANGMYRDPHQPMVYDMVTRLQFCAVLSFGYDGPSKAKLEEELLKSADLTLDLQTVSGQIAYGGRSNQFLHNETFYAALCEWYATWMKARGDLGRARRFRAAAKRAMDSLDAWTSQKPVRHVKNRFDTSTGFGCEGYAYFDKYMVTMGSWAYLAYRFADETIPADGVEPASSVFRTSDDFHRILARVGDYSMEFDWNAQEGYDANGLGRFERRGAPPVICLSVPFPKGCKKVHYRIGATNATNFAIAPEWKSYKVVSAEPGKVVLSDGKGAATWTNMLTDRGLEMTLVGAGRQRLTLPAFEFDGETTSDVVADEKSLTVRFKGWACRYETDGRIVPTGLLYYNRNGRSRRFDACGDDTLKVTITINKEK